MSSRKRTSVPLQEKKKYAQMILSGASRSTISDLYRKKYKSELSERTFRQWKKDSKSILEAKSNHEFIKERKKSSSMKKFEEKIKSEYVKRKIKLKKTAFVRQVQTEFFADDEEISNLKLSALFDYVALNDNCPSHRKLPIFDNIDLCFFKPGCTGRCFIY